MFPCPLHTLTFPHTLYTRCVSLSSVHTQVSLPSAPDPGNSCLQSSPFMLAACFLLLPSCVSMETPGRLFYRSLQFPEPTVPRAPIPCPAPDRLRRGHLKPHIGLPFKACSLKSPTSFLQNAGVVTCQRPFQQTACAESQWYSMLRSQPQ